MEKPGKHRHLVVVEAYDGAIELLTDEADEHEAGRCLGLPIEEIAERLDCRATVLTWDRWLAYERQPESFLLWQVPPVTRPLSIPDLPRSPRRRTGPRVAVHPIPARDPDHGHDFAERAPSPRVLGLLADSDPLFTLSVSLERCLQALYARDPFDLVVLPMWGGLGYMPQMSRATGCAEFERVPFVVVVTDASEHRQRANAEGLWTRPALTRRQSEDLSLALADLVLVFGERGAQIARRGRLPRAGSPVHVPRRVPARLLDAVSTEANVERAAPLSFFLREPQQPSSGVLDALDAAGLLARRGARLQRPITCGGPDMVFAPMKPRSFVDYWSSRGFVRDLQLNGYWQWGDAWPHPEAVLPVRLYPSHFEHLPFVFGELAQGSMVILSDAAAEGLAPGERLPPLAALGGQPSAARLAQALQRALAASAAEVDRQRRELCRRVVAAHRSPARARQLQAAADALGGLLQQPPAPQDLGQVARLLLDRRRCLADLALPGATPGTARGARQGSTLSVVIACFEMGELVRETVESVWASTRLPDEVLLIDDGSRCATTRQVIADLERDAASRRLPLRVIRQDNRGLAAARNLGLARAGGSFISFLDADDLIAPEFYRLAERLLERHPALGGVAAWAELFGEGVPPGFWNAPQAELPLLLVENTVFVPVMMPTELLRSLGGYDTGQRYNYEDWELSIRLLSQGKPIVTIPRYLQRYRVRDDSLFRTMSETQNQAMREYLLANHRDAIERFSVEMVMLLEGRLMRLLHGGERRGLAKPIPLPARLLRRARRALRALPRPLQSWQPATRPLAVSRSRR